MQATFDDFKAAVELGFEEYRHVAKVTQDQIASVTNTLESHVSEENKQIEKVDTKVDLLGGKVGEIRTIQKELLETNKAMAGYVDDMRHTRWFWRKVGKVFDRMHMAGKVVLMWTVIIGGTLTLFWEKIGLAWEWAKHINK